MARHTGPRPGSSAHRVMCRLVDLGGRAAISQLMRVLGAELHSVARFNYHVTDLLLKYSLVTISDDVLVATNKGKELVAAYDARDLPPVKQYVGQIVAPRIARPFAALDLARLHPPTVVREGAFDHRAIPSLMGGQRVLPGGEVVE